VDAVLVGAAVVLVELDAHVTLSGRFVTPDMEQKSCANFVADAWSAASHFPTRQHAMPLRKVELEQIHLMSEAEQPPIFEPVVNVFTHP